MSDKDEFQLPEQGIVFWPVGTGDSTTICVSEEIIMQVDLHHLTAAGEEDDPHTPIVDRLEELLPTVDGDPYLAAFVLTHPDQDHCSGFADLLDRVKIGELWFSPRVFREYAADLCDDAKAFRKEAKRRVKETISQGTAVESGDRVRVIGYDELLKEDDYEGFPDERLTVPGNAVTQLDDVECDGTFRAFVHAPFKDDSAGERNEASIALQVSLTSEDVQGRLLLLGDLSYPTIRRIFDESEADDVAWDVMLSAHHCSKSVMYWKGPNESSESRKQDILDDMEAAAGSPGCIIASSEPVPSSNEPGDNPPHAKAKSRYQEIAPGGFFCTQEYPSEDDPEPMVFEPGPAEFSLSDAKGTRAAAGLTVSEAVTRARGTSEPPKERVGFGRHD